MKAARREKKPLGGLRIGSVFGFEIKLDLSWTIIFFLVFWSLAEGVFPARVPDMTSGMYLVMALVATVLFFASLVAHELSHALVSRTRGVPVEGITLFLFGGVARARKEPDSARDELLIAGVGPLTSAGLALLFGVGAWLARGAGLHPALEGVLDYLALINLMLAAFNLLPGFPLDGGRVFRALAWRVTGDRMKATRWAVTGGRWLGALLMVLGAVQALGGAALSGLWLVFIGWFVRGLASSTLQHEVLRELMHGWSAADVMSARPDTVSPDLPLDSLVSGHFLRLRFGGFPVVDDGELVGLVTPEEVVRVPRDRWPDSTVSDVMVPLDACVVVAPDAPLAELLEAVGRPGGHGRVLVVDGGRLVGIVSAADVALWIRRAQAVEDLVDRSNPEPIGLHDPSGGVSHEVVDHTSELTLRLRAPSMPALVAAATEAFLELVPPGRLGGDVEDTRVLRVPGTDPVVLLVGWLNELVYLAEVDLWLPTTVDVREDEEGLEVRARGRRLLEPFVLVKAATLHDATVDAGEGGLEAEVTLDV